MSSLRAVHDVAVAGHGPPQIAARRQRAIVDQLDAGRLAERHREIGVPAPPLVDQGRIDLVARAAGSQKKSTKRAIDAGLLLPVPIHLQQQIAVQAAVAGQGEMDHADGGRAGNLGDHDPLRRIEPLRRTRSRPTTRFASPSGPARAWASRRAGIGRPPAAPSHRALRTIAEDMLASSSTS